jgi:hypothetical protein
LHSSNSHFDGARTFLSAEPSTSQRVFDVSTLLPTRMSTLRSQVENWWWTGEWEREIEQEITESTEKLGAGLLTAKYAEHAKNRMEAWRVFHGVSFGRGMGPQAKLQVPSWPGGGKRSQIFLLHFPGRGISTVLFPKTAVAHFAGSGNAR